MMGPSEQSKEQWRWHMKLGDTYEVKPFDLHGLVGISDRTLEMHLKLYEGYGKTANHLTAKIWGNAQRWTD